MLGLGSEAAVVLFSAADLADRRKGGQLLLRALELLPGRIERPLLLTVGAGAGALDGWGARSPVRHVGPVSDDYVLAACYSAADLYVLPTLADNLPNGILESMACGTPCVAFDTGGIGEAVRHFGTGYLARRGDPEDLARGIALVLESHDLRVAFSKRCREIVETEYTLELQARRYLGLYREAIEVHRGMKAR